MRLISDNYSLALELDLSISSQMEAVAGIAAKSSQKASMAFGTSVSSSQSMFVANRRVFSHKREMSTQGSPDNAIKLRRGYDKLSDADFKDKCGDGYVVSIIYGGELNLLAKLAENSNRQRVSVTAAFDGGSSISGTSFSTGMKSSLNRQYKASSLDVSFTTSGGNSLVLAAEPSKFIKQFNQWTVTPDTATPVYFLVKNYGVLRNNIRMSVPPSFSTMQKIALLYWRLDKLRNSISDMTDHDSQLRWGLNRLGRNTDFIHTDQMLSQSMKSLSDAATSCLEGMKGKSSAACTFPADVKWEDEYTYRAMMPYPAGPDMNTYYQLPRGNLRDRNWQYWVKDVRDQRLSQSQPMVLSLGRTTELKNVAYAHTRNRPYAKVHLTGSFSKSCRRTSAYWGSDNQPWVKTQCGYWNKPKDIFHKKTHHYRWNYVRIGTTKGRYWNASKFSNKHGHLKHYK